MKDKCRGGARDHLSEDCRRREWNGRSGKSDSRLEDGETQNKQSNVLIRMEHSQIREENDR